jgi:hypothetical protein
LQDTSRLMPYLFDASCAPTLGHRYRYFAPPRLISRSAVFFVSRITSSTWLDLQVTVPTYSTQTKSLTRINDPVQSTPVTFPRMMICFKTRFVHTGKSITMRYQGASTKYIEKAEHRIDASWKISTEGDLLALNVPPRSYPYNASCILNKFVSSGMHTDPQDHRVRFVRRNLIWGSSAQIIHH